jgi:hypothetical protein
LWWKAQTFTPTTTHKITKVKLKMYKMGNLGTLNAGVRATDTNGHPTGQDLCSGTIDANTFTTDTNGQWYEIGLGGGCNLSANTKYAVVIRVPNCTYPNSVAWRFDGSSATYSSGNIEITYDGGSSWTCCASYAWDFMFEEWGEPQTPGSGGAPPSNGGGGLPPQLFGDLDGDCDVDIVDIMKVASIWGTRSGEAKFKPEYDFDADGQITVIDVMRVAAKWNTRCP